MNNSPDSMAIKVFYKSFGQIITSCLLVVAATG